MNREMAEGAYEYQARQGTRQLKVAFFLGVVAFGVALAVVVGGKLSDPAATVLTGVVAGVAASVPVSFILVAALRGRGGGRAERVVEGYPMRYQAAERLAPVYGRPVGMGPGRREGAMPQAPVIVVTPGGPGAGYGPYGGGPVYPGQMPVLTQAPREFQVIGEPEYYLDEGY
jgi:hypothetical protein